MQLKLLVDGGEMKPGPSVSQKLGPLGINLGKIISEVNKATTDFKGMKVPVTLEINTKTKDFTISVSTPPTSELLKKEFDLKKGSPQPDKIKMANAAIEQIIRIAKAKQQDMLINSFKAAVKSVVGSCLSIGILVESKNPNEILEEIDQGKYDKEIKEGKEEPSQEKLDKLASDFEQVQESQEALIEELEKKAEEKAAAAAAPVAEGAETTPSTSAETTKEESKEKK